MQQPGPANSSPASGGTGGGCGISGRREAGGSMPRNQHDHHSANVCEQREPAQQQQQQYRHQHNNHYHNHRVPPHPSVSSVAPREQQIGQRMSLETLLQAAYYVEQEEKKRERLASTSSSSSSSDQHSFVSAPPHSNHTYASSEPRGEYHARRFLGDLL